MKPLAREVWWSLAILALSMWWVVAGRVAAQELAVADRGIEGVWINAAGSGYIELRHEGQTLFGTIVGGPDDEDRRDVNNPDPSLRDRSLTGVRILEGFQSAGSGKWSGGTIYDPDNGKTYRCILELEDEDTLKVRGYIGISLFGRTERWTRKPGG